jgi:hypothetical protein
MPIIKKSKSIRMLHKKKANAFEAAKLIKDIISTKHAYGCIKKKYVRFFSIDLNTKLMHHALL